MSLIPKTGKLTLTLNVTKREEEIIKSLADKKGMSLENLTKQALRMYQVVEGSDVLWKAFEDSLKTEIGGCCGDD